MPVGSFFVSRKWNSKPLQDEVTLLSGSLSNNNSKLDN